MSNSNQWVMGSSTAMGATIENDKGYIVAALDRSARKVGDKLNWIHPNIGGSDEAEPHATTDEQWQSIVDCIAAAPEMLAVLKSAVLVEYTDRMEVLEFIDNVKAVLAKAEPVRKVKVRVTFEVDVMPGKDDHQTFARARDEIVVCGEGRCVDEKYVHPTQAQ